MERSLTQFGAQGDGKLDADGVYGLSEGTDNSQAFADAFASLPPGGGTIFVPAGFYRLTAPLLFPSVGVSLIGEGKDSTQLVIDHADGPGVRLQHAFCSISNLRIVASETRSAAPPAMNIGIQIEPPDEPEAAPARMTSLEAVAVSGHPSHGAVIVSHGPTKTISRCLFGNNGGHGLAIDPGVLTERESVLPNASGFVDVVGASANGNGGHAIAVGHPEQAPPASAMCSRVTISHLDAADNAKDADRRYGREQAWIWGQDNAVRGGTLGGPIFVAGIGNLLEGLRVVGGQSHSVRVGSFPAYPTRGITVRDLHPVRGRQKTAVIVDDSLAPVAGLVIDQNSRVNISTLVTPGKASSVRGPAGNYSKAVHQFQSGIGSADRVVVPHERAACVTFASETAGSILVNSDAPKPREGLFSFRVGTKGARITPMAGEGISVVEPGSRPAGRTGKSGAVSVAADVRTNRLFIENRSGAELTFAYTLLNMTATTAVIGVSLVEAPAAADDSD